jgi:hypothetical protein
LLGAEALVLVARLIREQNDLTLAELCARLAAERGVYVSVPTMYRAVRQRVPDFRFMAEVYWGLEWTLQQQGFDYTHDKWLHDRLRDGHAKLLREHFHAGLDLEASQHMVVYINRAGNELGLL